MSRALGTSMPMNITRRLIQLLVVGAIVIPAPRVWAATCTYTGASGGSWGTGTNWDCGHVPGSVGNTGDVVQVTTDNKNVTGDTTVTIDSLTVGGGAGYSETLTINSGVTVTITAATPGASNINVRSDGGITVNGTLAPTANGSGITNAGTVTVNNAATLKTKGGLNGGGTYTFNSGSTMVYNSGTGDTVASQTYADLRLGDSSTTATYTAASSGLITVNGTLTVDTTAGNLDTFDGNNATIILAGSGTPFSMGGLDRFTENTSFVIYSSSTGATILGMGYKHLRISPSSGSPTFILSGYTRLTGDLSIGAGSLSLNGVNLDIIGGSLVGAGTIFCGNGNNTCSSGIVDIMWNTNLGGTLVAPGACFGTNGTYTFYDLYMGDGNPGTMTACGSFTVLDEFHINANMTFNGGAGSYVHTLSGTTGTPLVLSGALTANTNKFVFTGNWSGGNTTIPAATYNQLELNNASETWVLGGRVITNSTFTLTNGTFSPTGTQCTSGSPCQFAGLAVNGGTFNANDSTIQVTKDLTLASGTFNAGTSTIRLTGTTAQAITSSAQAFNNLTLNNTGTPVGGGSANDDITLADDLTVNGTLTITQGELKPGTKNINLAGNLTIGTAGLFTKGSGTLTFTTGDATFAPSQTVTDTSTGGPQDLGTVVIQNSQ